MGDKAPPKCRRCGVECRWGKMPSGKWVLVDDASSPTRTHYRIGPIMTKDLIPEKECLKAGEPTDLAPGEEWVTIHYDTCPESNEKRDARKKGSEEPPPSSDMVPF